MADILYCRYSTITLKLPTMWIAHSITQLEIAFTFRHIIIKKRKISNNFFFHCYTVHIVELLNYYTNHCTYIKFIKFTH